MTECLICTHSIIHHNYAEKNCIRKQKEIAAQLLAVCKLALEWHLEYPWKDIDLGNESDKEIELYEQLLTVIYAAEETR